MAWVRDTLTGIEQKEVRETEYRSSERNRVCRCVQGSSTRCWMVQEESQS